MKKCPNCNIEFDDISIDLWFPNRYWNKCSKCGYVDD